MSRPETQSSVRVAVIRLYRMAIGNGRVETAVQQAKSRFGMPRSTFFRIISKGIELKHCPFCGASPAEVNGSVSCLRCQFKVGSRELWNTRV